MVRRPSRLLILTALATLGATNALAQPPVPPPPPPPPPGNPVPVLPAPVQVPSPGPPGVDPGWRPATVAPPPPPGVYYPGRPPVLVPEPTADSPYCPPPGFFGTLELGLLAPHFRNRLMAPVAVGGFTDLVAVPGADLDWTGSPRVEVGYRLADGLGAFLVGYRSVVTEGTDTLAPFDALGPGFLESRLNMNVVDLDYDSGPFLIAPYWDLSWRLGVRIGQAYYDSRATGMFLQQRVSNNFVGAGPHAGIEASRQLDLFPGLALFGRLEGAVVVGSITQNFEETLRLSDGTQLGGATRFTGGQTAPVFSFLVGLSYTPQVRARWLRFALGYQFEQWWSVGDLHDSEGDLRLQGLFFRGEFNF